MRAEGSCPLSIGCAACCMAAMWLSGCAKQSTEIQVGGKVTFHGEPIEKGVISFLTEDGRACLVVAKIQDGRYAAKLPPGPALVRISSPKEVGQTQGLLAGEPHVRKISKESIPERYNKNSALRVEISAESVKQGVDFDLTDR